jgi:hypothetical protein
MTRPAPARIAAAKGGPVDGPQLAQPDANADRAEVGVGGRRAEAGEVLGRGGHAAGAQTAREGRAEPAHPRRTEAEAALLGLQGALGAHDVDDRREVDVHARGAQRGGGRAPLGEGDRRPPRGGHGRRAARGRAGQPLHAAALLIDHEQQRRPHAGRPRGRAAASA